MWEGLYRRLYPHRASTYLYTSRKCLLRPTDSYLAYFRSVWHPDSVIVDLFSTGASWASLFERLGAKGRVWVIGHVDNYSYLPGGPRPADWLDLPAVFRNSALGAPLNKNVEMLNYAPHPAVEDVQLTQSGMPIPVLAETLEYNAVLPEAAHRSFRACLDWLEQAPKPVSDMDVPALISAIIRLICADSQLPAVYAGHQVADHMYLKQILV